MALAPNLLYLGKAGARILPCGLRAAFLSGAALPPAQAQTLSLSLSGYTRADLFALTGAVAALDQNTSQGAGQNSGQSAGAGVCDVFLSSSPPDNWAALMPSVSTPLDSSAESSESTAAAPVTALSGCPMLRGVVSQSVGAPAGTNVSASVSVVPAYHISSSMHAPGGTYAGLRGAPYTHVRGTYTAVPPYRNIVNTSSGSTSTTSTVVTRLYLMAPVGNAAKQKDVTAFSITPMCANSGFVVNAGGETAAALAAMPLSPYPLTSILSSAPAQTNISQNSSNSNSSALAPATYTASAAGTSAASHGHGLGHEEGVDALRFASLEEADARAAATGSRVAGRWEVKPPPPGYACRLCGANSHFIRDCHLAASNNNNNADGSSGSGGLKRGRPDSESSSDRGHSDRADRGDRGDREQQQQRRAPQPPGAAPPAGYSCHACGLTGAHYISDCPVAQQRAADKQPRERERGERERGDRERGDRERDNGPPPAGYACVVCGSGEHYVRMCPVKAERDRERERDREQRGDREQRQGQGQGQGGLMRVVRALVNAKFIAEPETEPVPSSSGTHGTRDSHGQQHQRTRFVMSSVLTLLAGALQRETAAATAAGLPLAPSDASADNNSNSNGIHSAATAAATDAAAAEEEDVAAVVERERSRELAAAAAAAAHASALAAAEAAISQAAGLTSDTQAAADSSTAAAAVPLPPVVAAVLRALPAASLLSLAAAAAAVLTAQRARASSGGRGDKERAVAAGDADCWFCLSNPRAATHLVAAVADESYLALPRGPINGSHAFVLPIAHVPCLAVAAAATGPGAEVKPLVRELEGFLAGLRGMNAAQGLGTVVCERYYKTRSTHHMQVQTLGLPLRCGAAAAGVAVAGSPNAPFELAGFAARVAREMRRRGLVRVRGDCGQGARIAEMLTALDLSTPLHQQQQQQPQ